MHIVIARALAKFAQWNPNPVHRYGEFKQNRSKRSTRKPVKETILIKRQRSFACFWNGKLHYEGEFSVTLSCTSACRAYCAA